MKKLTKLEELQIINELITRSNLIDSGSSRAVFNYGADKVVKVVCEDEGRIQNKKEVEMYERYGYKGYLAEIYAYGKNIIIMEKVKTSVRHMSDEQRRQYDVIEDFLDTVLGTTDCMQVGINKHDNVVCYDYGFDIDDSGYNVGRISRIITNKGVHGMLKFTKSSIMDSVFK